MAVLRRRRRPAGPSSTRPTRSASLPVAGRPRLLPVHGDTVRHGELTLEEVVLPAGSTVVGRDREADLRLTDLTVSPRHVRLDVEPDGAVRIRDLGGVNTLRVDGVPVREAALHSGNRLELGAVTLVFQQDPAREDGGRQGGELGEQA